MKNLKLLRKLKGVSQKDVADYLGMTQSGYQRYETGTREPPVDILKRLADYFGVTVSELVSDSPSPQWLSFDQPAPDFVSIATVKIPVIGHVRAGYDALAEQAELEDFIVALCGEILAPANLRRWVESLSENEAAAGIAEQRQAAEDDLKACERKIAGVMDLLIDHPSAILAVRIQKMEAERDALRRRLIGLTQVHADGLDPTVLYNSTLELSEAILRVLRADDAPASAKRSALASFIHSIVIDRAGNVVANYMPPGYGCNPTAPRPENKKAEDGSVVSHPRLNLPAPPGVGRFGLQFRGVFLRTRKPRTRRR